MKQLISILISIRVDFCPRNLAFGAKMAHPWNKMNPASEATARQSKNQKQLFEIQGKSGFNSFLKITLIFHLLVDEQSYRVDNKLVNDQHQVVSHNLMPLLYALVRLRFLIKLPTSVSFTLIVAICYSPNQTFFLLRIFQKYLLSTDSAPQLSN